MTTHQTPSRSVSLTELGDRYEAILMSEQLPTEFCLIHLTTQISRLIDIILTPSRQRRDHTSVRAACGIGSRHSDMDDAAYSVSPQYNHDRLDTVSKILTNIAGFCIMHSIDPDDVFDRAKYTIYGKGLSEGVETYQGFSRESIASELSISLGRWQEALQRYRQGICDILDVIYRLDELCRILVLFGSLHSLRRYTRYATDHLWDKKE